MSAWMQEHAAPINKKSKPTLPIAGFEKRCPVAIAAMVPVARAATRSKGPKSSGYVHQAFRGAPKGGRTPTRPLLYRYLRPARGGKGGHRSWELRRPAEGTKLESEDAAISRTDGRHELCRVFLVAEQLLEHSFQHRPILAGVIALHALFSAITRTPRRGCCISLLQVLPHVPRRGTLVDDQQIYKSTLEERGIPWARRFVPL